MLESDAFAAIVWRVPPTQPAGRPAIHLIGENESATLTVGRTLLRVNKRHVASTLSLNMAPYPDGAVAIHYHRPDGDYDGWNTWAWMPGYEGEAHEFVGVTDFGRYALFPRRHAGSTQFFIIRKGDWEEKDWDHDRSFWLRNELSEAWVVSGDPRVFRDPVSAGIAAKAHAVAP